VVGVPGEQYLDTSWEAVDSDTKPLYKCLRKPRNGMPRKEVDPTGRQLPRTPWKKVFVTQIFLDFLL
jgi:hypothetical protein